MKLLKNKTFVRRCTTAFVGTLLLTTAVQATSLTKKIDATFRNIQVYYNNQQKPMAQEPFIYNNSVYLPVRGVSELVDKNVDWNSATNSVYVSDRGSAPSSELEAQIAAKNFEIAKLTREKDDLEKKVKELEEKLKDDTKDRDKVTDADLKKTLRYLEDSFYDDYSIDWDFKLSQTGSRINVEVSYDSRSNSREWDRLTKSQREKFFKDIAQEIRVDFRDNTINGKVVDRRTDKTVANFSYSTSNKFSYTDDSSGSFDDLEKDLKKYVKEVDGTKIPVDDIKIKGNSDDITFTVYIELYNRKLENEWYDAMDDNPRDIRKVMEYIQEEILRDYKNASVQGFIEDLYSNSTLAKFDGRRLY